MNHVKASEACPAELVRAPPRDIRVVPSLASTSAPASLPTSTMQSLAARSTALARSSALRPHAARSFASSASRFQAVPTEKPALNKEFKIYRWVRLVVVCITFRVLY